MAPIHQFIVDADSRALNKIDSDAVFLTGNPYVTPVALAKNVKHNKILHRRTVLLNLQVEDVPRIPNFEKTQTEKLGGGFYRVVARYGFMEDPQVHSILTLAHGQGLDLDPDKASFYVGRESLVIAEKPAMMKWRASLFLFMSRNATDAASFFNLPSEQVIEVGVKLEI